MKERCLIWREDDGEESREAALVRRGDRLCIEEMSRGPLTRAMFGASPYGRRIVIEGEFAPAVLAHALYADSTPRPRGGAPAILSGGGRQARRH